MFSVVAPTAFPQPDEAAHLTVQNWSLLAHAALSPNRISHDFETYEATLAEYAQQAASGEMTPDEAAAAATRQLRRALGDDLIEE
jgi:hypothetical protein